MADLCDLHVHTTASDGTLSPGDVLDLASRIGLRAIAISDHDTTRAHQSLLGQAQERVVEIIPAVELGTFWDGKEVHILGYYVPTASHGLFQDFLDSMRRSREERVIAMVKKLHGLGIPLPMARVRDFAQGDSMGRPHIARALIADGHIKNPKMIFTHLLGFGQPAYVGREYPDPFLAINKILSSGGVPVWAHPGTSGALHRVEELVAAGLLGIEAHHPDHDQETIARCLGIAEKHDLIVTGGSDFHGPGVRDGGELGQVVVGYDAVLRLKEAAGRHLPPGSDEDAR